MVSCCSPGHQVLCVATFANSYIDVISKLHKKNGSTLNDTAYFNYWVGFSSTLELDIWK